VTRLLTEQERTSVGQAARRVAAAARRLSEAHGEQQALWRRLASEGVTKAEIGKAAGVTGDAVAKALSGQYARANRTRTNGSQGE
jgi:transposase-like protein